MARLRYAESGLSKQVATLHSAAGLGCFLRALTLIGVGVNNTFGQSLSQVWLALCVRGGRFVFCDSFISSEASR